MTDLSLEILDNWQIRKTKKQKLAFEELLRQRFLEKGIVMQAEISGSSRNLVVGNPETASVVYTAHYDTQAVMPFPNFITPKNFLVFIVFQVAIALLMVVPGFLILIGLLRAFDQFTVAMIGFYVWIIGLFWFLIGGPANKHTANDNTSGVITLIETILSMPGENQRNAAFVFFDNEEKGMFGSTAFSAAHAKRMSALVVNYDCVSDGTNILVIPSKSVKKDPHMLALLQRSFYTEQAKYSIVVDTGFALYPSDQICFKRSVGVAALKKGRFVGLYLDRIHTKNDTVFDEDNIRVLTECGIKLASFIKE